MTPNQPTPTQAVSRQSLPGAARRWLERAIPADFEIPAVIRIKQSGEMDIRSRWTPFTAAGEYYPAPLAFTWRARLHMLPGVWVAAEDGQDGARGWGGAKMWGLIPMGRRSDPQVFLSQLVRSLGELPLLPPFALTDPNLIWAESGADAFEVRARRGAQEAVVRFDVDARGDILRAHSPSRPYDVPSGYEHAPWECVFSEHKSFAGLRIPARLVARFQKEAGVWEYFRAGITAVTFDR